ncbi:MAG: Na+/H+ antiporter subunit E [Phycisphaerales bacterium JB063]
MMLRLLLNFALTLLWMLLWQSASLLNGLLGFIVGALVITLTLRVLSDPASQTEQAAPATHTRPLRGVGYLLRLFNILHFSVYFIYILIRANLDVAWEIITPGYRMKPRMIRYPVAGLTPIQITTLANAITLTPGTLSADVDDAGTCLYIHAMYAEHRQDAVDQLDELRDKLMWLVFGRRPDDFETDALPTTAPTP